MARITRGILGGGRGKVANVVMGNWKGIDYLRAYAVPANPRSEAQVQVRGTFGSASQVAAVLNNFLRLLPEQRPKQSNFNYCTRLLFNGSTVAGALESFGTTNEPTLAFQLAQTGVLVLQGEFIRNDRIIAAVFQRAQGQLTGVFGIEQLTISNETQNSVSVAPYQGTAGVDIFRDNGIMAFTVIRGTARRVKTIEL
jgi:hypothetical protein